MPLRIAAYPIARAMFRKELEVHGSMKNKAKRKAKKLDAEKNTATDKLFK